MFFFRNYSIIIYCLQVSYNVKDLLEKNTVDISEKILYRTSSDIAQIKLINFKLNKIIDTMVQLSMQLTQRLNALNAVNMLLVIK